MASRQNWEQAEFPILCDRCLGDNPYIRMQKETYGKECKICNRPFTVFKWSQGNGRRFKSTEICQTCSKIKNNCQSCVLDLEYNLPVNVRDEILEINTIPTSDVNRQYFVNSIEGKLGESQSFIELGKADSKAKELLRKVARNATDPYARPNGDKAETLAEKIANMPDSRNTSLKPPADYTITSLYLTGIDEDIAEEDLRNFFYAFGEIKSIQMLYKSRCAFVNFAQRSSAEDACASIYACSITIKNKVLKVQWGKSRKNKVKKPASKETDAEEEVEVEKDTIDHILSLPLPPPPPGVGKVYYPSADPKSLGSVVGTSNV